MSAWKKKRAVRASAGLALACLLALPFLPEHVPLFLILQSPPVLLWLVLVFVALGFVADTIVRARTVALVAMALCALFFVAIALRIDAPPPPREPIRVVSFNTLHWNEGGGHEALRETLRFFDADILLLQEQSNTRSRPHDVVAIDGRADLEACCAYPHLFSRGGLVVASRFPGHIVPNASEDVLVVELDMGGEKVLVANVHNPVHLSLYWLREAPFSPDFFAFTAAAAQRRALVYDVMRALSERPEPVIVGGDFNATPLMPGFRHSVFMRFGGRLSDLVPATYPSRLPLVRIDHVLSSGHFSRACAVLADPMPVSDHRPVGCLLARR